MIRYIAFLIVTLLLTVSCTGGSDPDTVQVAPPTSTATHTLQPTDTGATISDKAVAEKFGASGLTTNLESWATTNLPYFITAPHVDLADIAFVSKFRSTAGHDFSDSFEICRSMKHYFHNIDHYATRFTQPIYSMVDGVVFYLEESSGAGPGGKAYLKENTGYEAMTGKKPPADYRDWSIYIRPDSAPNVWVQHMHVNPLNEIVKAVPPVTDLDLMRGVAKPAPIGYRVQAGELIAHGLGEIIVKRYLDGAGFPSPCNSGDARERRGHLPGCRDTVQLHSIFEFMTDSVLAEYQKLAKLSRSDLIFTAEERDANPMTCNGEQFTKAAYLADGVNFIQFQDPVTIVGKPAGVDENKPGSEVSEQPLPGFSALASGRETIASFEASGADALSEFRSEGPYLLVIASGGGPIEISLEDGSGPRRVYSRPSSSGASTYETKTLKPGQIEISVEAGEGVSWQIVVVKSE